MLEQVKSAIETQLAGTGVAVQMYQAFGASPQLILQFSASNDEGPLDQDSKWTLSCEIRAIGRFRQRVHLDKALNALLRAIRVNSWRLSGVTIEPDEDDGSDMVLTVEFSEVIAYDDQS